MIRLFKLYSISAFLLLILFSCQTQIIQNEIEELAQVESPTWRISKESTVLTSEDAMKVAMQFSSSGLPETRGKEFVRSIVPVKGDNEESLLYGVNFEDGYLLISGTKNYYPILAEVEHGYFDGNPTGTGVDVLLEEMKGNIRTVNANPELRVDRSVWSQYEELEPSEYKPETRSGLDDVLYDFMYDLGVDGWTVYSLRNQPEDMPDDLYLQFCDAAFNECGEDPDYDYNYYTFIAVKPFQSVVTKGPLITTSWGQENPYYLYSNVPLGCTTIATGQVMRFFKFPPHNGVESSQNYFPYYLSEMPDTICSYNANLCGFLHDLKYQIGVYTGGGSNISNVVTALQHYRYTCRQITHSADSVYSSVNNDRPVLMFGEDSSTGEGHAWVCDGTREYDTYNLYRLYVFRYEDGIPSYYDLELEEPANRINYVLFHMNWGWNGSFDGYYHDTNYLTYPQGDPYNPTYGREEILVNKPILL